MFIWKLLKGQPRDHRPGAVQGKAEFCKPPKGLESGDGVEENYGGMRA